MSSPAPAALRLTATLAAAAVVALAAASPASATIAFADAVTFPAGGDSAEIATGDFNRDGSLDAVTANPRTGDISVLLGDGTGQFGAATTRAVGGTPGDVATGDFNRDGNRDLIVGTQNPNGAVLLPGIGDGTFGPSSLVPVGAAPDRVAVGDVTEDGVADVVTTNRRSAGLNVTVVPGDGAGGFGAPVAYNVTGPPADVALADVNGDGRPDIVTADRNPAAVSVLFSNADGSFGPNRFVPLGGIATGLVPGDFNGDDRTDLAVTRRAAGVIVVIGNGQGQIESRAQYPTGLDATEDVAAVDLDSDGKRDLVAYGSGLATLRGGGDGTFEDAQAQVAPPGLGVTPGDVDGDGVTDLLLAAGTTFAVMPNTRTLPAPEVGESANLAPVSGTVRVREPGSGRFVELQAGQQIPLGSKVDTRHGSVRLTTASSAAGGSGARAAGTKTQTGTFHGAIFKLGQSKDEKPITKLTLTGELSCTTKSSHAAGGVGIARRRSRRLFGNARGRFRTRGRHSTATVRGTKWSMKDTCRTTLTVVQRGTVVVRDLRKHRTVKLHTGDRYLARATR